jgi:hypothetical protein
MAHVSWWLRMGEALTDISRAAARAREAGEPELADALKAMGVIVARARDVAAQREAEAREGQAKCLGCGQVHPGAQEQCPR